MEKKYIRPMIIIVLIQFFVMVGFGIVIPILPYLVQDLGGNALSLGIFMSAYSIMQFFFAPFWGRLSDRIGRRPVLLIGISGYGLTFIFFGMIHNLWLLIAVRALSGMVSSATLPTSMAYLADITEGADRSKSMGMIGAAMGLGMVFGPALGGWLGHYSFSTPFFVAGALALAILPFAWSFLPETLQKSSAASSKKIPHFSFEIAKDPLFALYIFNFIISFSMAMFETTFAMLAAVKVGFGPKEMGTTFTILGIFGVIVQGGLIGKLVKRFGDANLVKAGAYFCAIGLIFILIAPNAIALIIATILFMVGNSLMSPTSSALVTKQGNQSQGASLGLFQSFASLGRILGPIIGGALYGLSIGLPYVSGSLLLLGTVLIAGRKLNRYEKSA
ncbi:MFS transporter [Desulfitobacterium metallireducens]|uniref:Arabinose ABC transporter permease n=1 Tax=Desulfitobacterium metallireducens DSM 15288 TaxID=871968 RepID=W0E8J8_9FIRM|nr:tetracycline resistance MFS efflux pump [Desulfitobacterium metallireducens]AHF07087.1 arabinose ABC transporter permease [Desulfitobacterium metallireducens DSM 15288]